MAMCWALIGSRKHKQAIGSLQPPVSYDTAPHPSPDLYLAVGSSLILEASITPGTWFLRSFHNPQSFNFKETTFCFLFSKIQKSVILTGPTTFTAVVSITFFLLRCRRHLCGCYRSLSQCVFILNFNLNNPW